MSGWSAHVAIDRALVAEPRARASAIMLGGSIVALALGALMVAYAFADLAQRRREEAQLLELQKVEAIGRFTGTVVHDFKKSSGCDAGGDEPDLTARPASRRPASAWKWCALRSVGAPG